MAFRYALPVLAVAGAAYAQCSSQGTQTVASTADALAIASCTTFTGSIAIPSDASGDIDLGQIRRITGDLTAVGAQNVSSITAQQLSSIGGKFTVDNLQNLNSLNFLSITSVGQLTFQGLPNLNQLNFPQNIKQAASLRIENTFLSTLSGINLQSVDSIYIANNRLLQDVSFQVSNLTGTINVESNGDKLVVNFPNLITARNITIRAVPSISIPSLSNTTGSLGFYENSFTSLYAPNLTAVGGTLAINTNMQLSNITFPVLKTITGGLQVQNNTVLSQVTFPSLQTVTGATDMYGNFTSVSLPALKDNRGAFNIQSSQDITSSCNVFNGQKGASNVIKGKFQCAGNQARPGGTGTSTSSTSSKAAAVPAMDFTPAALGLTGVIAAVFGIF